MSRKLPAPTRDALIVRLRGVWLIGAFALVTVGATVAGMHIAQEGTIARVLHSREVLRQSRMGLSHTIDRASALVVARITGDSTAARREPEARRALLASVDALVALTRDNPVQQGRALALRTGVRRWVRDTSGLPDTDDEASVPPAAEVPPTFDGIRGAFGGLIEAEEALYAQRVRASAVMSQLGLGAVLLQILLLIGILRWFRVRVMGQAMELVEQQERLEEQAVELELQVDESRELARELESSNRELTDRERLEREAREAILATERRYRSLIEQSLELITLLDVEGRFRFVSGSVERMLGYTPEELVGVHSFDHLHPEDVDAVRAAFDRLVASPGEHVRVEYRYRHRDGGWRRLASIGTNLLGDDAMAGIVVNSRDMTDERQLEEQLHQAQKMEAVGRLAGGVAHDFNNLLTSIKLNCQILHQMLEADRPEREEVHEIGKAADRATALTRQLLAFSRKQILQPRVLDLNESVRDVERMLRRLLGEDIEIHTRLDPALPPVLADPGQLQQVLMNLAVNAGDAMPEGGELSLETASVFLDDTYTDSRADVEPGRYVALVVSDTGIGMDEETRVRIFEPFFTTKPPGEGTGLGLSTVYGIVRQSGGHVWAYSEKGRGTTFKLYFPAHEEFVAETEDEAVEERCGGTETILVVEDEPHLRPLIVRVLRQAGYSVLEAANGADAVALSAERRDTIDLVITDVVMPGMNGREFAGRLAEMGIGAKLLYMSGYTDDEILRRGVLVPGTAFLQKPFAVETLLRAVRRVLDTRRTGSHAAVR